MSSWAVFQSVSGPASYHQQPKHATSLTLNLWGMVTSQTFSELTQKLGSNTKTKASSIGQAFLRWRERGKEKERKERAQAPKRRRRFDGQIFRQWWSGESAAAAGGRKWRSLIVSSSRERDVFWTCRVVRAGDFGELIFKRESNGRSTFWLGEGDWTDVLNAAGDLVGDTHRCYFSAWKICPDTHTSNYTQTWQSSKKM